jgi:hypothetical protein
MSYSITEAKEERWQEINQALVEADSEKLYILADIIKGEGDDEEAERLLAIANRINDEEWAFDRERDNNLD